MYGKKIKNLAYVNHNSKVTFNTKFGGVLCKLELRLNVLILRMGFVNKLQQADFIISTGKCVVNNVIKHKRYFLSAGDLTAFKITYLKTRDLKRFKKLRWRSFK
jgi:ribosomal protein S4